MTRAKRYGAILRVSSMNGRKESADSTMTLTDQARRCSTVAALHGGAVAATFDAADVSGWISTESPEFQRALHALRGGELDGLVFAYLSRQARNTWAQGMMFAQLEALGADCWFADHSDVDYRSRQGRMLFGIMGTVNQDVVLEAREKGNALAERVILERGVPNYFPIGYRRNAQRLEGKNNYGPKTDPDLDARALVPDPETAPTVRRIFELRADGVSWTEIGETVGLSVSTVRGIVRNEAYLGVVQYKRREHRKGKLTGKVLRNDHAHQPLVSRALWTRAQSARTVQRTGTYEAGVAGGLVTCSGCRKKLAVSGSEPHLTYSCRRQSNGRCPAPVHVTKRAVDTKVDDEVRAVLHARISTAPNAALAQLHADEAEALAELERYVEHTSTKYLEVYERGLQARERRYEAARTAREAAEDRSETSEQLPTPDAYLRLPLADRRRVAADLLSEVSIQPVNGGGPADRVVLSWR